MKEKGKIKEIDDYVNEAKTDIYVYIIVAIILFFILLYISYKVNWYYLLLFHIFFLFSLFNRIIIHNNLKKIREYLIKNKLINKIGKIDFWNENHYFLTEKYMIIIENNIVNCFPYSDITSIRKEINYIFHSHSSNFPDYLYIVLNNNIEYKILIFNTCLTSEKYCNISSYLLNKNKDIIIEENIVKINHRIL